MITPAVKLAALETRIMDHENRCLEDRRMLYKVLAGILALSITGSGFVVSEIIQLTAAVEARTVEASDAARQADKTHADVMEIRADVKRLLERK